SALDNCTYLQTVDAATGPAPLSYTFTVPVTRQTIGGTVSGLTDTLVLTDNGTDTLVTSSNGPFTFAIPVASTVPYNVAVASQPTGQLCTVSNGSGTIGSANVTDVAVTCVAIQQDVTNLLTMSSSGFVLNRATQTFNFRVTLANSSTTTFAG